MVSTSKIARIEGGSVGVSARDVRDMLDIYGVTDRNLIDEIIDLARSARRKPESIAGSIVDINYLSRLEHEEGSATILSYAPTLIPDIMRGADYQREIIEILRGTDEAKYADQLLALHDDHTKRIFESSVTEVRARFIIDEAALRRNVGGADVMIYQLTRAIELMDHPGVVVRVIPFIRGLYNVMLREFELLEFDDDDIPDTLILSQDSEVALFEGGDEVVSAYKHSFWELEAYTSEDESRAILLDALDAFVNLEPHWVGRMPDVATDAPSRISVDAFIDTNDEPTAQEVFAAVDALVSHLELRRLTDLEIRRGSFFRRGWTSLRRGITSRAFQSRLLQVERAIELGIVEGRQADVDLKTSEAASGLIASLGDVPRACIRVGSLLIVKYTDGAGAAMLVRQLSAAEIQTLELYPEIQSNPEKVLAALILAASSIHGNDHPDTATQP